MGRFSTGASAVAESKATASRKSSGDFGYFSLGDGESAILRFLNGIDDMYVYDHECGIKNWEIGENRRKELVDTGQFVCPNCKKPFADSDLVGKRSGFVKVNQHEYVPSPSDGRKRSYICLEGSGTPCPICAIKKEGTSDLLYPVRSRIYGAAIVRTPQYTTELRGGVPFNVITSLEDHYVQDTDKEGKSVNRLDVVLVQQGWGNFWATLASSHDTLQAGSGGGISWYDWLITRIGADMNTKYSIEKVTQDPNPISFAQYESVTPDIMTYAENMGSPEYYVKNGFHIEGFVAPVAQPEPVAQPAQQTQFAQQMVAPVGAAPVQVAPQPVAVAVAVPASEPVSPAPVATPASVFQQMQQDNGDTQPPVDLGSYS